MTSSFLLEVSTVLSNTIAGAQDSIAQYLPFMANSYVFGFSVITAVALPILVILLTTEWDPKAPPRFSYFFPAIFGSFNMKKEGPLGLIRTGYKKFGDIFRIKIAHQGFTFLIGPEANCVFFEASDRDLTQKEVYGFTVPVFGRNIVYDADPNIMVQQLKFVRHGLNGNSMKNHSMRILQETTDYFSKWGDTGVVDLKEALSELTILTAARCLLGAEVREKLYRQVAAAYQYLNDGMTHLSVFWPHAPTKAHKLRDNARAEMATLFSGIIRQRREDSAAGLAKHDDYLQDLVDAKYRDGTSPTDDEILGLLLAALFAGQHTSSITSTWVGLNIYNNKAKLLPRLLEEQRQVLRETGGELTFDALSKMDLLHCCMKEALRLYPPIVVMLRYVQNNLEYKGYSIPKGDIVVACPPISHRMPEIYADPEAFDPDRFMPERNEGSAKNAYIAFGGGRHACLGEKFGYLQVKTIWSILMRNFDFELVDPLPLVDHSTLVVGPHQPCRVKYTRKNPPFKL